MAKHAAHTLQNTSSADQEQNIATGKPRIPKTPPLTVPDGILAVVCTLCLTVTLLAAGFAACTLPMTTEVLSNSVNTTVVPPYTPQQLTRLAEATRAFTVDNRGANDEDEAKEQLCTDILDAALEASADTSPVHDRWNVSARSILTEWQAASNPDNGSIRVVMDSPETAVNALARINDAYALDTDALNHLDDCNRLINSFVPWLWALFVIGAITGISLFGRHHRRLAGWVMVIAPIIMLVLFAVLGIWASLDFFGLFSVFHQVFFPQGNWQFSDDSLLISMYPLDFWVGMGCVWLGVTVVLSILSLIIGIVLIRSQRRNGRL